MLCDCGTIPKDYIHSCGCSIEILSSQGETCLSFSHPKKGGSERDCFPSFCFLGLLQLLTQKVKMSEPYKTILWLIKFHLEGRKIFPFFSTHKRSDRIKLPFSFGFNPGSTVCCGSWARTLFFREEASKAKSPSPKVWETEAKRGNTGNLVIAFCVCSCQILDVGVVFFSFFFS